MPLIKKQFTIETLDSQKKAFTSAIVRFDIQNASQDADAALEELHSVLNELETRGMFERPQESTKIYRPNDDTHEREYRDNDALESRAARLMIARHGLKILQRTIPFLTEFGNRCLEVAGKEAVRDVCAPTPREGTDFHGQPYKPLPSGFVLPPGYESSIFDKAKSALKR